MGDEDSIAKARKALAIRRKEESSIAVELEIKDDEHLFSDEVMTFCVTELSNGTTWNALRRKLGLGPAHIDRRWRKLKDALCSSVLPENVEEALEAQYSMNTFIVNKLEEFVDRIEERVRVKEGAKNEADFWKLQLNSLETLSKQYQERFDNYIALKKVASDDRKKTGPSIIFQNNYYVPRPGDNAKEVVEATGALRDAGDDRE